MLRGLDEDLVTKGKSEVVNVRRNKDGEYTGNIISAEEMEEFREKFRENLQSAAERLASGEINASRRTYGDAFDSCKFCGYSGICLIDTYR